MHTLNNDKIHTINSHSSHQLTHTCSSPPRALQPLNRSCHNLCKGKIQPPPGAVNVLGLGLNYCLETPLPSQGQRPEATKTRLLRDIRLGCFFKNLNKDDDQEEENNYDPKLYVANSTWTPKPTDDKVEAKFDRFCQNLTTTNNAISTNKRFNLTSHERYTIRELADRKDLIVGLTDKNLGPFIAPREQYIQDCLNGHLLKEDYYRLLSETEMTNRLAEVKSELTQLYTQFQSELPDHHQQYFERSFDLLLASPERIAQFYGTYKAHKEKQSVRPVISCCGTFTQVFSKYIDHWMKKVVQKILPTYIKNANTLINELEKTFQGKLPPGARLFSVDTIGMYSNICSDHGIEVAQDFLHKFKDQLPEGCPTDFLIAALELVMKNNIFQFGDTYWLQLIGCAMGTSAAVNYSYTYIGLLEMLNLLPNFKKYLLFYG